MGDREPALLSHNLYHVRVGMRANSSVRSSAKTHLLCLLGSDRDATGFTFTQAEK